MRASTLGVQAGGRSTTSAVLLDKTLYAMLKAHSRRQENGRPEADGGGAAGAAAAFLRPARPHLPQARDSLTDIIKLHMVMSVERSVVRHGTRTGRMASARHSVQAS